ncbi:unnamed protein product [Paramecium sonneborni]|uniref:Uncharacterized protein n=1 Tax=Paramecium sonneborni TaxID=65129 RepID=A0A8S1Q1V1_9CILI|nr:unnamed protein product [Paramecium sonneborni]
MNQSNLIQYQVLDSLLQPLMRENNENPLKRKSLLIKFNSAKITSAVIKLNQKPKNIVAMLTKLQNSSSKSNQQISEYIKFNYFTSENQKHIYNSSVTTDQFYTQLQIKIEQDDIAFYNIQIYGQEAQKNTQRTLDNFILKPSQMDNENGTFKVFTDAIQSNRDPAGREKKNVNKYVLKQQQEYQEALEKSLISAQYEQINQKLIQESIENGNSFQQQQKNQSEFEEEELSLEILMGENDLNQYQYQQKKQPQINIENLGYTDNKKGSNLGYNQKTVEKKGQEQHKQQQWKSDQIKLHLMTQYKAGDIDQAFMQMHKLMEISSKGKSFLENVMYN